MLRRMIIEGGEFICGRFREDEIRGEAFVEVQRIFLAWDRPTPPWPPGTTFTEPHKERHWSSMTTWAFVSDGAVRYELLLDSRDGEPDPREVPPVIWTIHVDRGGTIFALPRIAHMHVTLDPPHPVEDDRKLAAYAGVPLGLEFSYRVGQLSRPLREDTREVSDGWSFR